MSELYDKNYRKTMTLGGFLSQINTNGMFFLIIYQPERKLKTCTDSLVLVHLRVHVAVTAAQFGFVVVLTVNALIVPVFFAVAADHNSNGSIHFVIF